MPATLRVESDGFRSRMIVSLSVLLSSCVLVGWGCAGTETSSAREGDDKIILVGTMHLADFELGCWQFISDDGKKYEVTGINAEQLRQQGLRAEILVRELKGIGSVCTAGELVELLEIITISE